MNKEKCSEGHLWSDDNLRVVSTVGKIYCKMCNRERVKRHYRENPEKYRAYRLKSFAKKKKYFKERNRKRTEEGRSIISVNKWVAKNPHKVKAHKIVREAIKKGELKRGNCIVCGSKKTDGHHPDYTKPLEVMWLCRKHHKDEHWRLSLIQSEE